MKERPNVSAFNRLILVDDKGNKQHAKFSKNLAHAVLHREDGPAIEYTNGYNAHYKDGLRHGTIEFGGRICSTWKKGVRID